MAATRANLKIKRRIFLNELEKTGIVGVACQKARISRTIAYEWREKDEAFAAAWLAALEESADLLEEEARRRAHDGVDKPVYQGKELVGYIREYSDTLLIFLLKGIRPEKYRETVRHENTGKDGGPIEIILKASNGGGSDPTG